MTTDRVGTALWTIVAGSSTGGAVCAATLFLIPKTEDTLLFMFAGSLAVAVLAGWFLSRPIVDLWRRAVTAAICAFGATLLVIGTMAAALIGQAIGLATYGIALVVIAVLAARRA